MGLESGTEWALLANYREDLQQLKNKVALDIAKRIGMKYTPDSTFVNLYVDGKYNGLYLLAQRVSVDGGSVKINDLEYDNKSAAKYNTVPENISGGYLMEMDNRLSEEDSWFSTENKKITPETGENAPVPATCV